MLPGRADGPILVPLATMLVTATKMVSPVVLARYKRAAGFELTEEERAAVRTYERRYDKTKMGLYVPEKIRDEWTKLAESQGQSVSEWARTRIAEAVAHQAEIARLESLLRTSNVEREEAVRESLRHAQQVELLKRQLDDKDREYSFLLRRLGGTV